MRGRTTLISLALPASMELEAAVEDVLNARLSGKV
jgi:hypothetical protein